MDPLLDGLFGRDPVRDRAWDGWDRTGLVLDDVNLAKGMWDIEVKVDSEMVKGEPDSGNNGVKPVGFLGLFFRCVLFSPLVPTTFPDIFIVPFSVGTTPSMRLPATNTSGSRISPCPTMLKHLCKCFHIPVCSECNYIFTNNLCYG